jgi:hypothetical protein
MTTLDATDFPAVTIGAMAHPAQLLWPFIEKRRASHEFSYVDAFVDAAERHHIPIMLTFGRVPIWHAKENAKCDDVGVMSCPGPPKNIQDWKNFVIAIANHYKGRVQYYELWNEANLPLFWTGTPHELVSLAKAAYPLIKSIDPNAILLGPSVGENPKIETARPDVWMRNYLQAGGGEYADGLTWHGYTGGRDPEAIVEQANLAREIADNGGLRGKPILNTEGGWGVLLPQGPDNQAAFIARWYILQAGLFVHNNLRSAAWFAWGYPGRNNWGTIEKADRTPTQAGVAFNEVYKWMVGASLPEPCTSNAADRMHAVWTCNLTRPGGYQAQAIWNTAGPSTYKVPAGYARYRDLAGNTVSINGSSVSIGPKPILLEKGAGSSGSDASIPTPSPHGR